MTAGNTQFHGYKRMLQRGGEWVEEALISITKTEEGEEVHCESENRSSFGCRAPA
jgi:hypothetical protein